MLTFLANHADRGVDLSAVQHVDSPTRDVLVIFDSTGDREFIGFGSAEANQFADCFISAAKLPEDTIRVSPSGSVALETSQCPVSKAALRDSASCLDRRRSSLSLGPWGWHILRLLRPCKRQ